MKPKPKYESGQSLLYVGDLSLSMTKYKTYRIYSRYSHAFSGYKGNFHEYVIIRDDGQEGMWWETELKENFRTELEIRKEKLIKLNEQNS